MAARGPGKRALKAEREARRAQLSTRLADLLRALGLGASASAELLALAREDRTEGVRAALARHSGASEGDMRRRREAEALLADLAALTEP